MFRVISSDFRYAQYGRQFETEDQAWDRQYDNVYRVFGEKDNVKQEDRIGDGYGTYEEAVVAAQQMMAPGHYDFVIIENANGEEVERYAEERPHAPDPMVAPQPMIAPQGY